MDARARGGKELPHDDYISDVCDDYISDVYDNYISDVCIDWEEASAREAGVRWQLAAIADSVITGKVISYAISCAVTR
jgi:hypothetical protein